jgi:hypothetical protein
MKRGCPTPITHDVSLESGREVGHLKSEVGATLFGSSCFTRAWTLLQDKANNNTRNNTPPTHHSSLSFTPHASRPAKTPHSDTALFVSDPCRTSSYYPSQLPHLSFPGPSHYDLRALILLRETALSTLQLHLAHDGFFGPLLVESQTSKLSPCTL